MAKAAAAGAIDYSEADPSDPHWHWWHDILLDEIETMLVRDAMQMHHRHWTVEWASEKSRETAGVYLTEWLKLQLPWMKEAFAAIGKPPTDKLVETYHEMFGRPGEPRYEKMLEEMAEALKPLTESQKLEARAQRYARQAAAARVAPK